jgi:hypothetical protein
MAAIMKTVKGSHTKVRALPELSIHSVNQRMKIIKSTKKRAGRIILIREKRKLLVINLTPASPKRS